MKLISYTRVDSSCFSVLQNRGVPFEEGALSSAKVAFFDNIGPILDYYRKASLLMEIDAEADIETVFRRSATAMQLSLFKDLKVSVVGDCDWLMLLLSEIVTG